MSFRLSENIDHNKIFLVQKSEIKNRLDSFYYIPKIVELENKVLQKKPLNLINYVKVISSGATPKTSEREKYYTDKEYGIPFLRVQNLSPTGNLNYDNLKYINEKTHNGMLARSKVDGSDLLVKITGAGRLAVASVAPQGFEGNINHHMVVIKTESEEDSKILAAFLNSDIGEKLASRRSTGGTRPALDYHALLSIPVIYDKRILEIIQKAVKKKEAKDQEARDLLASINGYLLGELGINIPGIDNRLEDRIFEIQFLNLTGSRFDPEYQRLLENSNYTSFYPMNAIQSFAIMYQPQTITQQDMEKGGDYMVFGANGHIGYYHKYNHVDKEVIVTCRGATCGEVNISEPKSWITGNAMVIHPIDNTVSKKYLFETLKVLDLCLVITGSAQPQITRENLKKFKIPLPPFEKQNEIAEHIHQIREKAKKLQEESKQELENANREVEKIILGE